MLNSKILIAINEELGEEGLVLKPNELESIFSSYFYYATVEEQIIALVRSVAKNHVFKDGNKRTAVMVLFLLAEYHHLQVVTDSDIFNAIIRLANDEDPSISIYVDLFFTNGR